MKKIKFKVRVPKRRNPVALPARRRKAGAHRDRRKEQHDHISCRQEWLEDGEMD